MTKISRSNLDFQGFDWTELGPVFGVTLEEFESEQHNFFEAEKQFARAIREHLDNLLSYTFDKIEIADQEWKIKQVRRFVEKIAEIDPGCYQPLWRGLSEVKNDYSFLTMVYTLLECMWT